MTQKTRYKAVGFAGRESGTKNQKDSFVKTYEFDINAVLSGAEQDTGVAAPSGFIQSISAVIVVETAEVTGGTKTVDVGIVGQPAVFLNNSSVASTGPVGTPITAAIAGGANFSFTLGSADFVQLEARCVITVVGSE